MAKIGASDKTSALIPSSFSLSSFSLAPGGPGVYFSVVRTKQM
jgi:hypothetical protein